MDTTEIKNYPEVKGFLDSISKTFKQFEAKRTGVIPSQSDTMYIINQISKQNEMKKKREQLNQKVALINQITCSHTCDFEKLCNELIKSGEISVSFFLDDPVSDQLDL
jgi:hypothetical protein